MIQLKPASTVGVLIIFFISTTSAGAAENGEGSQNQIARESLSNDSTSAVRDSYEVKTAGSCDDGNPCNGVEFLDPIQGCLHSPSGVLSQEQKLEASDGESGDDFGYSVAMSGGLAVVGARHNDDMVSLGGAAYVFHFDGKTWIPGAKLTPSDAQFADRFGSTAALSDNVAIFGAEAHDNQGAAYVYRYDGSTWAETKLVASDGQFGHDFGSAVSVYGDLALVGARNGRIGAIQRSGAAYVFRFDGANWIQEAKLNASDAAAMDDYGIAGAITDEIAVVGAWADDDLGAGSGSAYVYRYDGTNWNEEAKLLASDGAAGDQFGHGISIYENRILIGARANDDGGSRSGSAYVFRFDGTGWVEEAKLLASDAAANDSLGDDVSLSGLTALVGARGEREQGPDIGAVYMYQFDGSSWVQTAKMKPLNSESFVGFGQAVALSGDIGLIGAGNESAYIFTVDHPCDDGLPCTQDFCDPQGCFYTSVQGCGDLNCDGIQSLSDIGWFVTALLNPAEYEMLQPDCDILAADCSGDGFVTTSDIGCFVAQLTGGLR